MKPLPVWRPLTSRSATPWPSVPGSQAATNASERLSSLLTYSGRPATNTVATGAPLPLTRSSTARSSGRRRACSSERLPRSPLPSAYGVSPITAITASYCDGSTFSPVSENVTSSAPSASRRPARIVVPFGKSALVLPVPCQVRLQPPVWFCSESAVLPTTSTFELDGSGSSRSWFLSSTSDSRTASRASAGCCSAACEPACSRADGFGWSIRPVRSFTRRIRVTASSIRSIGICARVHLGERVGDERPSSPAGPSRCRSRR